MAKTLTTSWQTIASYNWKPGTGFNFTVYLEARYTSQDKTGNYSKLKTRLRSVVNAGSGSGYGYGWNCSYCNSISGSALWTFDTETILSSSEQVIYHNADGTKTLTLSASGYVNGAGFSFNISDSVIFPTIERVPTITLANDFNDEENPVIEFTNPAGFTINGTLSFSYTDQEDMFIGGVTISRTNITSPYTFSLTDTERTKLRSTLNDRKEYTVKYTLQAFNGSTYVGEVAVRKKFTFINAKPTFTSAFVETDANVISLLGTSASKLIKNASKVKTTIVPSAKKSATIKSVEIKHGTYDVILNASPYVDTILALSDTFEVIVTDSRGYEVSSPITKDLIDYSPIEISKYSFKRVNPTSSNIVLNATIKYTQQTFNSTANKPTLKWKLGADGTLNAISSSNYSIDTANKEITINNLTLSNVLPYTQQGRLYLVVNDLLTSDSEYYVVSVGIPVYDYGEFDLQVNGDLYIADRNRQNKAPLNVSGNVSKNLFNGAMESGKYNTSGAKATDSASMRNTAPVKVEPSTIYIFSNNGAGVGMNVFEYDENYTFIKTATISGGASFTTSSTTRYINFYRGTSNVNAIQLEKGSTATEYEEYYKPTISIRNSNAVFQEINIIEDTGWINATLTSKFATYSTGYEPIYRKQGKLVEIQGVVKPTSALSNGGGDAAIFNLPEGYRPSRGQQFVCQGSGSNRWLLTVNPSGAVNVSRYGTTSFIEVPSGAWLPFNVVYMVD